MFPISRLDKQISEKEANLIHVKTLKILLNTGSVNEIAKFSKLEVWGRQEAPSFFLCKALHLTDLAQGQSADVS